jgi:PAS domain S-box-containing protein
MKNQISDRVEQVKGISEQVTAKQYTQHYVVALGIIAVFVTIAFAALKFILPDEAVYYRSIDLVNQQQVLVQQIANQVAKLTRIENKQIYNDEADKLRKMSIQLKDLHQSILYGNSALDIPRLTAPAVQKIYFHSTANLDKLLTEYYVNAKLLYQLPLEKVQNGNEYTQQLQQLAHGQLPALLEDVKSAYKAEISQVKLFRNAVLAAIWLVVVCAIIFTGLFVFRPLGNRIFKMVENLKKIGFQYLAAKKKLEVEKQHLDQNSRQIQSAFDAVQDAFLIYNFETKGIKFNKRFAEIWQLPVQLALDPNPDKLVSAMVPRIRNEATLPEALFDFQHAINQPIHANLILDNDYYLECYLNPIKVNNQIVGKAWTFVDVSSHILMAKKYAEQSKQYLEVINSLADGLVVTDEKGKVVHCNQAAESLLGISAELNSAENWYKHLHVLNPDSHEPLSEDEMPFIRASYGETIDDMDLIINGNDNEMRIKASGHPIKDAEGHVKGGVVIIRQPERQKDAPSKDTSMQLLLDNSKDGIFFIDENLQIGEEISRSMLTMFGGKIAPGQSVKDFFANLLNQEQIDILNDYVQLIFHPIVTEKYVDELNPIRELAIDVEHPELGIEKHFYEFKFARFSEGDKITRLMVTVRDITQQIASVKKMRSSQKRIQKQIDLLFRIIHVDPAVLEKFVDETASELAAIHLLLKKNHFMENLGENLQKLSRSIIAIKEHAAFLDLRVFEEKAAAFEKMVLLLHGKTVLTDEEQEALVAQVNELHILLDEVKHIIDHLIHKLKVKFRGKREEECRRFLGAIESYAKRIGRESGKRLQLDFSNFDAIEIPYDTRQILRDVLTDMLQNIIQNDIELPAERKANGKSATAKIQLISVKSDKEAYEFILRDDGKYMMATNQHNGSGLLALPGGQSAVTTAEDVNQTNELMLNSQFFETDKAEIPVAFEDRFAQLGEKIKKMGGEIHAFTQNGEYNEYYIRLKRKNIQEEKSDSPIIARNRMNEEGYHSN